MRFVVGQLTYMNWNTVQVFGTLYDPISPSTQGLYFTAFVDPNLQQSLRIQVENNSVQNFNEQLGPTYGNIGANDIEFLC